MNSAEIFHFLRPYVLQPLSIKNTAYLRLYRCARRDGLAVGQSSRKSLTTSSRRRDIKKDGLPAEEDAHAARSHAISSRIQELNQANALAYPRIQPCASPMRIPAFREKYKDVSTESPGQEEVVLRGMQNHHSYEYHAHNLQGDCNMSVGQVRSWCFWI